MRSRGWANLPGDLHSLKRRFPYSFLPPQRPRRSILGMLRGQDTGNCVPLRCTHLPSDPWFPHPPSHPMGSSREPGDGRGRSREAPANAVPASVRPVQRPSGFRRSAPARLNLRRLHAAAPASLLLIHRPVRPCPVRPCLRRTDPHRRGLDALLPQRLQEGPSVVALVCRHAPGPYPVPLRRALDQIHGLFDLGSGPGIRHQDPHHRAAPVLHQDVQGVAQNRQRPRGLPHQAGLRIGLRAVGLVAPLPACEASPAVAVPAVVVHLVAWDGCSPRGPRARSGSRPRSSPHFAWLPRRWRRPPCPRRKPGTGFARGNALHSG